MSVSHGLHHGVGVQDLRSKRSKILHANAMVQTMGNTHLDLGDYARLHVTIHCGPNQPDNVMRNPLTNKIPTQYHVFKVSVSHGLHHGVGVQDL